MDYVWLQKMAKWRNFREEIEEEFAEFREYHERKAENQKLMLSHIENCHVEQLRKLLSRGVDPNFCNRYGESPLHIATEKLLTQGSEEVVELLIFFGAPLERRDRFGITALHIASQVSARAVCLLLDAGSPVNCQDNAGRTALMLACESGTPEALVITQSLLDRGANVSLKDEDGKTALHYICSNGKGQMAVQSEIVYKLLYAGASLDAQCNRDFTPLCNEISKIFVARLEDRTVSFDDHRYIVYRALIAGGATVKCFQRVLFFDISKWDDVFLKLYSIVEPLSSVSQVKQLIGWYKCAQRNSDPEVMTLVLESLKKSSRTVRTLKCSCRTVVRTELLARGNSGNIFPLVDKLNLPKYLEDYLVDTYSH